MKSKHPELVELAYAAYAAIRRWEDNNEAKKTTEGPDLNRDHQRRADHPADRRECDGLTEPDGSGHSDRAGADLDWALCVR